MGKMYVDVDDKALNKYFRKQAVDFIKGEMKKDLKKIIREVVEEKLDGSDLIEVVKKAIKEVLPIEKITRKGMEANAIKKDWITGIINDEIAKRIRQAMPSISIDISNWEEIFNDK